MVCSKEEKMKFKFTFKIWIFIICLALALLTIFSSSGYIKKGVLVSSIDSSSSLFTQGMKQGDIIKSIDNQKITSLEDYTEIILKKFTFNETVKTIIQTENAEYIILSNNLSEITVKNIPKTNLLLGLDLAGGARALVKAQNQSLDSNQIADLVDITRNRLNAFGLSDLKVVSVSDLSGEKFMLIEIAGATPKDLHKLISEQGKFEAKIINQTVFIGGEKDIASVGRDAQNARINGCNPASDGSFICTFEFTVTLSPEAAKKHADITQNMSINYTDQGNYLSEKLDLYLDDRLTDSLLISEGLKGRVTTQIAISGSGAGATEEAAYTEAKAEMKQLQTILMTGSLPYKLEIIKLDTVSPTLGSSFSKTILIAGLATLLAVSIILFLRYRNFKISLTIILNTFSEVVLTLGVAALIRWNIDVAGIAGILASIGTGVDDIIVIVDESIHDTTINIAQRIKKAFAIIMGAYFTVLVSMLPLIWNPITGGAAGAGLLQGFAITTIIGISVGVFIARPAFSDIIKQFKHKEDAA